MADRILVLYGSYRSDRMGIRLADYVVAGLKARGADVELVDAKAVGLPMLDRMYKEHPKGQAPAALEARAQKIRDALLTLKDAKGGQQALDTVGYKGFVPPNPEIESAVIAWLGL